MPNQTIYVDFPTYKGRIVLDENGRPFAFPDYQGSANDLPLCIKCGRVTHNTAHSTEGFSCFTTKAVKVVIHHKDYGCDTGCCGHAWDVYDDKGNRVGHHFTFDHPYGDREQFIEELKTDIISQLRSLGHTEEIEEWDTEGVWDD